MKQITIMCLVLVVFSVGGGVLHPSPSQGAGKDSAQTIPLEQTKQNSVVFKNQLKVKAVEGISEPKMVAIPARIVQGMKSRYI